MAEKPSPRIAVAYILHDDAWYVAESIASFRDAGPVFAFVSKTPWHDQPGNWERTAEVARDAGTEVVLGEWHSELEHRLAVQAALLERGFTHALIPDGDEIIEPELLRALGQVAESGLADRVYVQWDTYWKSQEYVIRPREQFTPCILVNLHNARPLGLRNFEDGRPLFLSSEHGIVHHLSYCGPDERIQRKLATWGHRDEVVPGWYENVWLAWDSDKLMRNLHPTHPGAYGFAERVLSPQRRRDAEEDKEIGRQGEGERALATSNSWASTRVSIVIPVCGGADDLRLCLKSLQACGDLVREVIIVDNASPDNAADVAESFATHSAAGSPSPVVGRRGRGMRADGASSVRTMLLSNATNRGFAAACNQGFAASTGDVVLFLNSDTVVPRAGLERLIEALMSSGSIAAAGPFTNYAGHGQQIAPTYTSLDRLDLFAEDFAERDAEDVDADMLVGFCLAVKRSVLDEIGGFDERFGLGTFEDNDLCYRLRRAGYRLVIAARSFVHHSGSKTLARLMPPHESRRLLEHNAWLYQQKWADDLESGYVSHLPGLPPVGDKETWRGGDTENSRLTPHASRLTFDPSNHPDKRRKRAMERARRADISLCMIVKDEERVLGAALASARPFFREIIVVDTGSTDRTVEIAEAPGAKVHHFPWQDSFSAARNESLRHATGKWIFWMDADDTLPFRSGELLQEAALTAPPSVAGFIVPVQFVEDGAQMGAASSAPTAGTRVDHVKLFRNLPGLEFEGRIHEQILGSLRAVSCPSTLNQRPSTSCGQIVRCGAVVLHSGYDTSPEGQAKKRARDAKLLMLDLEERPDHPFVLFNLGMTDHYTGEHDKAIEWFTKCLAVSGEDESHVRKAYALMSGSLRQLGRVDEALAMLEKGLSVVGGDPELHFQLAHLLTGTIDPEHPTEQLSRAYDHYTRCLQSDPQGHFGSFDVAILGFKTWHNLAGVCQALSRYQEARDWWRKAVEAAPRFLPSAIELFGAALEAMDLPTARAMMEHVRSMDGPGEVWAQMGARYGDTVSGPSGGEEFLRRAIADVPESIGARLVLSRRLLEQGREAEAEPLLRWLADAGVAGAAFYLGVGATRRGDLAHALEWTERALALNPGHAQSEAAVHGLREALGVSNGPLADALPLDAALEQVAADYGLNAEELKAYAAEDTVGGYSATLAPVWPGGSVWEVEGQTLYALTRALKPEVLVEVGSLVGCSTSHLAAACVRNGCGTVYAVDPHADFSRVSPELLERIVPVKQDVLTWQPPDRVDLVFEDGTHEPGFTRGVLEHLAPALAANAAVLCHDYCRPDAAASVAAAFNEAVVGGRGVLIAPSNCGLGYGRAAQPVAVDAAA